jgi:DUF2934 family protein
MNYPTEEQVRARACQLYLERGGQHGHHVDDWLQAELSSWSWRSPLNSAS